MLSPGRDLRAVALIAGLFLAACGPEVGQAQGEESVCGEGSDGGSSSGASTEPDYVDISGTFLVAIDTPIAPGLPLQFLAEVTTELAPTGDHPISIEFQPLSLDVGSTTEPREEVGDAIVIAASVADAAFTLEFGETTVIGPANPITGSDLLIDITLEGTVQGKDAWCGVVSGDVLSPVQAPLEGSVFGAMRLSDRSERPLEFPTSCAAMGDGD